jgi:hypothetical protein
MSGRMRGVVDCLPENKKITCERFLVFKVRQLFIASCAIIFSILATRKREVLVVAIAEALRPCDAKS